MAAIIIISEVFAYYKDIRLLHINSVLCLKCPFLVVHIIVKTFGFSYDPTSYKRRKMATKIAAIIII